MLSKAYWSKRDFEKTTLEPPLGSGPYRVESVEPGRSITYRRVKDYWAAKLPVNVGRDNFDSIRYDYYRDTTVALEAFKGGRVRLPPGERRRRTGRPPTTSPAVTHGLIRKEEIPNEVPTGMQGFVFNTRRPIFQDPRVRRALAYAFDFEWSNKNLFYGAYTRTRSYFSNSELASRGLPGAEELKVLEPFRGKVPDEVFTREYQPPTTDGSGNIRDGAREALRLLGEAGWTVKGQKLVNAARGADAVRDPARRPDLGADRAALREEPRAARRHRARPDRRRRPVREAAGRLRLRHDRRVCGRSRCRRATSSATTGAPRPPTTPGSRNLAGIKDPVGGPAHRPA